MEYSLYYVVFVIAANYFSTARLAREDLINAVYLGFLRTTCRHALAF
jgi:hypothetical protein